MIASSHKKQKHPHQPTKHTYVRISLSYVWFGQLQYTFKNSFILSDRRLNFLGLLVCDGLMSLYMCVCVCVCVYIYIYMYVYIYMLAYKIHACIYIKFEIYIGT